MDEIWRQLPVDREVPLFQERKKFFLSTAKSAQRVLDLGCGDGAFTSVLDAAGIPVVGADVSTEALSRAKDRNPNLEFRNLSLEQGLPFEDASFDLVICSEVIGQVVDTQGFLSEVRRVICPSGKLAITVPYHGRLTNLWTALAGFEKHFSPLGQQLRFYTKKSLTELLETVGFEVVNLRAVGGPAFIRQMIFAEACRP